MSEEAQKLLMMFIADSYNGSGKPTKRTQIQMITFVRNNPKLQKLVNRGKKDITSYRLVAPNEKSKIEQIRAEIVDVAKNNETNDDLNEFYVLHIALKIIDRIEAEHD